MIGDGATLLAKESASLVALGTLKAYDDELVRTILLETRQLDTHLTSIARRDPAAGLAAQLLTHHHCLSRSKRSLLIYHSTRLEFIKRSAWSNTSAPNLSHAEANFAKDYTRLITAYKDEFLDVLDVTGSYEPPPDDLMCTIVAERDARDVVTERGTISLRRGERMRVNRREVQSLLARGWVTVVEE